MELFCYYQEQEGDQWKSLRVQRLSAGNLHNNWLQVVLRWQLQVNIVTVECVFVKNAAEFPVMIQPPAESEVWALVNKLEVTFCTLGQP